MATDTKPDPRLATEFAAAMARLNMARTVGDTTEERLAETKINALLDEIPRQETR